MFLLPAFAAIGIGLLGIAATPAAATDQTGLNVTEAAQLRVELGLDGDLALVANLIGSPSDVGSPTWGIPMTRAESQATDLPARMGFADHVDTHVLPLLRQLPTYAGAYYDPADDGRLTILLTELDDSTIATISARIGDTEREWGIALARHSKTALLEAVDRAQGVWAAINPVVQPIGFGIDARQNGLFVELLARDYDAGVMARDRLETDLGVPVTIRIGTRGRDTHCTTRDHCHDPMKAGINIYKGANFSSGWCTQGFHITRSGDEQFVTAGHCGFSGSNSWYHPAFASAIGTEQQTLYANNGQDIMRVSMNDAQASDDIYNDGNNIVGSGSPATGETLCASLGKGSNTVKCGTVQDDWRSWISETAGYTVWGGDMSYSTVGGDSGSPVYRRLPGGTGDDARAIGVNDHENGYFARLDQSLDNFAASVVQ
jgi:hypothetical protein